MAGMLILFGLLPWLSPKRFEVGTFRSTYLYIMLIIISLLAYTYALVLWAALLRPVRIDLAITGGVYVMFALLGNVMGKVRRNFYIGIRTPWTLANERVWYATHRFGGKTFVVAGLAGLLLTALDTPSWMLTSVLIAACVVPVAYSLIFYKRLERRGEL
jgi:uncharacterized membrane protein